MNLSPKEARAIDDLQALAKRWPKSLMLFSASGTLCVMPNEHAADNERDGARDPGRIIATIDIPNDGGDW